MAKVHLDRLHQRYGWTGGKYAALISKIIGEQSSMVANRIGSLTKGRLDREVKRASKHLGRNIQVPDISDVLPKRSVFLRKAADRGELLTDTLRDRLTKDLRNTLTDFIAEGAPTMQYQRGERRGQIKPELVRQFEKTITNTFAGYAKRDPSIGVPPNIHTIAVTEVRSVISDIKHRYTGAMAARLGPNVKLRKRWVHHPTFSKEPRPGHARMNNVTRGQDGVFQVPVYERIGTIKSGPNAGKPRWRKTGAVVPMQHPHDPAAPISEVATCHCELDYVLEALPEPQTPAKK